jgi:glutamate synthase (NADPH/NADH) small chain
MFEIIEKLTVGPNVTRYEIKAPRIAKSRRCGQFVIVRALKHSERIPLTIADVNTKTGTITIIVQTVGKSTLEMATLNKGDSFADVAGPLGQPSHIQKYGTVAVIGGGLGTAVVYPLAVALRQAGNKIISIIGARTKDLIILDDLLGSVSDRLITITDDGSSGKKGLVTDALRELIEGPNGKIDAVYCAGPVIMMKVVSELTRPLNIPTIVSLNPVMVDGTGMCGGCRVTIDNKRKFACVDGPEFDGHKVNFDELMDRLKTYKDREDDVLKKYENHQCKLDQAIENLAPQFIGGFTRRRPESEGRLPDIKQTELTAKQRLAIPRQQMPQRPGDVRNKDFKEVNLGLAEQVAIREAQRCLQCKNPKCVPGCPVDIDIPGFIDLIAKGNFLAAAKLVRKDDDLPAVTGRVCPQEIQCEASCVRCKSDTPVAIGWLERFVADYQMHNQIQVSPQACLGVRDVVGIQKTGKKVACIGSGPAGITCAGQLAKLGCDVTIFEAFHKPGGVLVYGIPEFRMPKAIVDAEVRNLKALGVKIETDVIVGRTVTIPQLINDEKFDAVFIAVGAGLPEFMNVPGENLKGVYSANEYLTRTNLMEAYNPDSDTPIVHGKRVCVIGGGNTAMDAVRTSKRLGAVVSAIVYRRSQAEMPARAEEIHHAEEENIKFEMLTAPLEVLGDKDGWVRGLKCIRMQLGEPDQSGRRRPVPVPGSEFTIDCDVVIVAIGTGANPLLTKTTPGLKLNKWGYIETDENLMTSIPGVFAGGDIVRGSATVILAMGDGKKAAQSIHNFLSPRFSI